MLTDERLDALRQADGGALNFVTLRAFRAVARVIEEVVMARDEVLIRQMLEALVMETTPPAKREQEIERAIAAARTRLDKGGKDADA